MILAFIVIALVVFSAMDRKYWRMARTARRKPQNLPVSIALLPLGQTARNPLPVYQRRANVSWR